MNSDKWFRRGFIAAFVMLALFLLWFIPYSTKAEKAEHDRIYFSGYEAGLHGQPPEACPYPGGWAGYPNKREKWLSGWSAGNRKHK